MPRRCASTNRVPAPAVERMRSAVCAAHGVARQSRHVAAANREWKVLPHEPLEQLEDNLWRVEGALPNMPLRRVMTIARRRDGGLVIHNGIALEDDAMARIERLGEPRLLIVPNGYHRMDAPAYRRRYPGLRVVCPAGARKKVAAVVDVDLDYGAWPADPDVTVRHLAGVREAEGAMIVRHGEGATVVLNDLVFDMPHVPGFTGWVLHHVTHSSGGPRISRIARMLVIRDRAAVAEELRALADTPGLRRVIVSHHRCIVDAPADVLRSLAASL